MGGPPPVTLMDTVATLEVAPRLFRASYVKLSVPVNPGGGTYENYPSGWRKTVPRALSFTNRAVNGRPCGLVAPANTPGAATLSSSPTGRRLGANRAV